MKNLYLCLALLACSGEVLQAQKITVSAEAFHQRSSNLSFIKRLSYWAKKLPEMPKNMQHQSRKMIKYGRQAQKHKNNPREKTLSISQLLLYHPLRGPTAQGRKPTLRSLNARIGALKMAWPLFFEHQYQQKRALEFNDWEKVAKMKSKDEIQIIEFRQTDRHQPHYLVISGQGRVQAMLESFPGDFLMKFKVYDLPLDICRKVFDVRNGFIKKGLLLNIHGEPITEEITPERCSALCPGPECGPYGQGTKAYQR